MTKAVILIPTSAEANLAAAVDATKTTRCHIQCIEKIARNVRRDNEALLEKISCWISSIKCKFSDC